MKTESSKSSGLETRLNNTKCEIMLDQLRAVDKSRLLQKETHLRGKIQNTICSTLVEMFCKA
jgi:hypothetical protein